MEIEVRFRGLETSEFLRDHAVRKVQLHLSRFGQELSRVTLRISDINGPKGGVDKRCQITVLGPRCGTVSLDELSADPYSAVELAAERIGRAVGRELQRARARKYRGAVVEE